MPMTLKGRFDTRRGAEMAVERLVQEHGVERSAIDILPDGPANSVGDERAGSDAEAGAPNTSASADAALEGAIIVTVKVEDDTGAGVRPAFAEFGGEQPAG